ncbi:MAG TPA: biotin-dependent carboxyltransferase family protein [Candidatus Dormibacteraeota bacterium]|jgi:antagonist of KipI|nr:biotin-dependent carboxyltransferase family protein [Candidatus Dormibacteraeota bacterium]
MDVLRIDSAGVLTMIEDLGRPGHYAAGVPLGGAMDRFALSAANLLVGNPPGAPGLECTLAGPTLTALRDCLVAVTGADFGPCRNGHAIPGWTSAFLARGDVLSFSGRRYGARAYVAVAGGLAGQRWLGSASTYLAVERGGRHGRQLEAGDVLESDADPTRPMVADRTVPPSERPDYEAAAALRVVPGPHLSKLSRADRRAFFETAWEVSRDADRMGYRLEGPSLELSVPALVSFGLTVGCIQLPPGGRPILLLVDHQTAGGYPVLATLAGADLPLAAQLLPGDRLSFAEVSVEAAQEAMRDREHRLARIA